MNMKRFDSSNGKRFSCPNCGFKADWFIPDKRDMAEPEEEKK